MPRDPKRIDPILQLVRLYWKLHPDLRLGQLITIVGDQIDPFYLEDDQLREKLAVAVQEKLGNRSTELADFLGLAERQQDLSPEIQRMVDEHFWKLVEKDDG